MLTRILILLFVLSVRGFGQSVPYAELKTLQDCAKELRQLDGVKAEVKLEHSNPEDTRDFQLSLETPNGRSNVKVSKDGTFRLPQLPKADQEHSRVTHSLEKGALTVSFEFHWNGQLPGVGQIEAESLFALCSSAAGQVGKFDHVFTTVGEAIPEYKEFQMAFVGGSFPREKPCPGLAILKNGEKTVATIDLSQTGKASWMFDEYDPKTHRVVWEMKNGEPAPKLFMEVKFGKAAVGIKGAIFAKNIKSDKSAN